LPGINIVFVDMVIRVPSLRLHLLILTTSICPNSDHREADTHLIAQSEGSTEHFESNLPGIHDKIQLLEANLTQDFSRTLEEVGTLERDQQYIRLSECYAQLEAAEASLNNMRATLARAKRATRDLLDPAESTIADHVQRSIEASGLVDGHQRVGCLVQNCLRVCTQPQHDLGTLDLTEHACIKKHLAYHKQSLTNLKDYLTDIAGYVDNLGLFVLQLIEGINSEYLTACSATLSSIESAITEQTEDASAPSDRRISPTKCAVKKRRDQRIQEQLQECQTDINSINEVCEVLSALPILVHKGLRGAIPLICGCLSDNPVLASSARAISAHSVRPRSENA
jgi:hypothetical protein